jgi:Putative DNA-binding domain
LTHESASKDSRTGSGSTEAGFEKVIAFLGVTVEWRRDTTVAVAFSQTAEEYRTEFREVAAARISSYDRAVVSLAALRDRGELHMLRGSVRFTRSGDTDGPVAPAGPLDYGDLVFIRTTLDPQMGLDFVELLVADGIRQRIEGYDIAAGPLPTTGFIGGVPHRDWPHAIGAERIFNWPSREFTWYGLGPNSGGNLRDPYGILVSPRHPPIIRATPAIDSWTGYPFERRMNPSPNLLFVDLPDYRFRFRAVVITDSGLTATTESLTGVPADIVFQATAGSRGSETPIEVEVAAGELRIPISDSASTFHIFGMSRTSGYVYDWVEFDLDRPQAPQIAYQSSALRVSQLIENGENQYVEWKGAIGEREAIGEFFESVVAFANTNDGLILVGVDDRGHYVETDPNRTRQRILDLLETRSDPPVPGLRFEDAEYDGRPVLLVSVPKGPDPPYILRREGPTSRSELYTRKGDKDRPMGRAVLDQLYAIRTENAWPAR